MQQADLEKFQRRLVAMRERVREELTHMIDEVVDEERPVGEHERTPVPSEAADKDVSLENLEENVEHEIAAALERIVEGTFGRCTSCGRQIARRRLEAIPYASHCIDCERKREQRASS